MKHTSIFNSFRTSPQYGQPSSVGRGKVISKGMGKQRAKMIIAALRLRGHQAAVVQPKANIGTKLKTKGQIFYIDL
jgi:hypothetical protein